MGATGNGGASYWAALANAYQSLGPPLCPSPEDLAFFQRAIQELAHRQERVTGLLMGATTAVAHMPLPKGSFLMAADHSFPMVKSVWPGDVPGARAITCADWRSLPLADHSVNLVIADGSLNCLRFPGDLDRAAQSLRRVMSPDGRLIARCYLQAETPEPLESIFEALFNDPLPSFHHFKLQLLMAIQREVSLGARVSDAWRAWSEFRVDVDQVVATTGWDRKTVQMIELYRGSETVHTFPTRRELTSRLSPYFQEVDCFVPGGAMGDRTPTLVFAPRRG